MTPRTLLAALLLTAPAAAADPIRADLDKAKAAHARDLARLRDQLLADMDAVIRAERDRGAGINYLLKERKGFAENGVTPVLPKLLPAAQAYAAGRRDADAALEAAYATAIRAAGAASDTELAIALRAELKQRRAEQSAVGDPGPSRPGGTGPTPPPAGRAGSAGGLPADAGPTGETRLVPLYRFYDKERAEHLYTHEATELAVWRRNPVMKEETVVGYVSTVPRPDTRRLWRALRKDGKHLFYLQAPPGPKDTKVEDLVVYVWTKPGDGRVPVDGCCLPDGTDMFLDRDPKIVKQAVDETFSGIGVRRASYPAGFYLYERPPASKDR